MNIHPPSYYIREEMKKANLKAIEVAEKMGMKKQNFNNLLNGTYNISPNLAIKLGIAFPNTTAAYWMDIQMKYNLHTISRN